MRDGTGDRRNDARGTDELLDQVARYVQTVRSASGPAARARAVLARPGAAAMISLVRSLPTVGTPFSGSAAGRELRSWFGPDRLLPADRVPVAVLGLPATTAEYLRGRSRQALRTNLTGAARAGITAHTVTDEADLQRTCGHIAAARRTTADVFIAPHVRLGADSVLCAAHDATGQPLGAAHLIIDGTWAGLDYMVTATDQAGSQLARYVLQAHLAGVLIERGVHSLVVRGSMLLSSPGVRYYQRRTGFQPVRLRLLPEPAGRPEPAGSEWERPIGDAPAVADSAQAAREVAWSLNAPAGSLSAPAR